MAEQFMTRMIRVFALELDRLETAADTIREGLFPQEATDEFHMLGMWEQFFELPVESPELSLSRRQARVLARYRGRKATSGAAWVELLTDAMGTTNWSHEELGNYRVGVHLPFSQGSPIARQIEELLKVVTPAHLDVFALYGEGFVLNESPLSEGRL